VRQVLEAAVQAAASLGMQDELLVHANYFPTISVYAQLLETRGFEVTLASLFDRPTPLEGGQAGLRDWLKMFRGKSLERIPEDKRQLFFERLESYLRPSLWRDGRWYADYRRLRIIAQRVARRDA